MSRARHAAPAIGSLFGLLLLAGCADLRDEVDEIAGDGDDDGPRTVAYDCEGDREFEARFSGDREEVRVDIGGRSYELEYTDSNDGRRIYSNQDDVELRVDEEEAYLRIPGESDFEGCERT